MSKPSATETEAANVLLHVFAESGTPESGGFNFINLLLPLALVLLIVMMFRKQRKVQKNVQEQRSQMVPGTDVMTNFGLFGTIVSIDEQENKAVMEISPGTTATVHMQVLTKVIEPTTTPADVDEHSSGVPDDASSLTDGQSQSVDRAAETPQETAERLDRESKNKDN